MYEATVSIVKENAHLLNYVKDQLEPAINEVDGLVSELNEDTRNYFSLACADTYRFQIRRKLNDAVSQALTLGYKNIFVRKLLGVRKSNFFQDVLVNTICIFDNDYDRQAVSRILDVDRTLCLDGYYNFRLSSVKKKWQEVTKLVSDNFYVLSDSELIVEFLQYLLESTPCKVKKLSVSIDGNSFVLYGSSDKVLEPVASLAKNFDVEEEVMLNVLYLKPQKVKVYHTVPPCKEFCEMLDALFDTEYVSVH